MRLRGMFALLFLMSLSHGTLFAQRKACEDLKSEIAAKLDAKGVKNYTLNVVATSDVKDSDKVVGSCDGGARKITYTRG